MLPYRSPVFVKLCITVFDRDNSASIDFDDFIQCSIMVKSLTDQFRSKDVQQRGVLELQYEEVLTQQTRNVPVTLAEGYN